MIYEKYMTPANIQKITKIFSVEDLGVRSPYPTVDNVVIEK